MSGIIPIKMPKWGLSMAEGTVLDWHKKIGDVLTEGDDLVDIETAKITNVASVPETGILRRITVENGEVRPVGALIGIIADPSIADAEIDSFIEEYNARFVVADAAGDAGSGLQYSTHDSSLGPIHMGQRGDGSSDPIIFLHGYSADLESWAFTLDAFGEDKTLLAFDLPGHGASTKNVGSGSIAELASALQQVLQAMDIGSFDLVGHSLGAAVALKLAEAMPQAVRKVALIAPAGLDGTTVSQAFLDGLLNARRARDMRAVLEMLVANPAAVTQEMVDNIIKAKRIDGATDALTILRDQIVAGDMFAGLQAVAEHHQSLVIRGDADQIVIGASAVAGEARVIADAGHVPHLEKASEVNSLLKNHLG